MKINLTITTEPDGFEKLAEVEAEETIMNMIMDALTNLSEEFTPGEMKLYILDKLADKLNDTKTLSISTVETIGVFIDQTVKMLTDQKKANQK